VFVCLEQLLLRGREETVQKESEAPGCEEEEEKVHLRCPIGPPHDAAS
jgi:hypothetical protein